jgi:hypothetical protein
MDDIQVVTLNPVVLTTAYTANRNVGGVLTAQRAFASSFSGRLRSVRVWEVGTQKAPLDVLLFRATPPAAVIADNAAVTFNAADAAFLIGHVAVPAAGYVTLGGISVTTVPVDLPLLGASSDLAVVLFTSGTPTFAAANAMSVALGIQRH